MIHALPPWSVWAASGLAAGRPAAGPRAGRPCGSGARPGAASAGSAWPTRLGFALLGPWLDRRGVEWAFYEAPPGRLRPGEPRRPALRRTWDRAPYATPFGPVPHDWAVRLFYLDRPASCRFGVDELADGRTAASASR